MRREPNDLQYRTAAVTLSIAAALTATLLGMRALWGWQEATLALAVLVYVVSQIAYALYVGALRIRTTGAKLGIAAIMLNLLALDSPHFGPVWITLTACSIAVALAGIFLLFRDATRCVSLG